MSITHSDGRIRSTDVSQMHCSVKNGAAHLLDEPKLCFFLADALELANTAVSCTAGTNTLAGAAEDDVEVHAENTSAGIVLDAEVDVFIDTETEVA